MVERLETRQLLAATAVAGAWTGGAFDQFGLVENGIWQLDLDGDFVVGDDSPPFGFGRPGDLPVVGDWNGNGVHSVGVYRAGRFYLDFNDDRIFTNGIDVVAAFGLAGDRPIIGNWNGTGGDDLGIVRNARWSLDTNGNLAWGSGDTSFTYGLANDRPVAGNWNPINLRDGIGIYRNGIWAIDANENYAATPGVDPVFSFGVARSQPFTGDFANDNTDEVAIVTNGTPFFRSIPRASPAEGASPSLAASTVDGGWAAEATNVVTSDDEVESNTVFNEDDDNEREAIFSREGWAELEEFTLTGGLVQ